MGTKTKKRQSFKGIAAPHIGKMLKKVIQKNKIVQAVWARKQGVLDTTVVDYFKKSTMQTSTLFDICQIIDYNIFKDIADSLPANMLPISINPLQEEMDALKKENEKLLMKIEILEGMLKK